MTMNDLDDVPVEAVESKKGRNWWLWILYVIGGVIVIGLMIWLFTIYSSSQSGNDGVVQNDTESSTPVKNSVGLSNKECGDGICGTFEDYSVCPVDCSVTCGDGVVQDDEGWISCRIDLLSKCGDGICEDWEHYRYCSDCSECIVDDKGTYAPGTIINGLPVCEPSPRWNI